MSVTKEGGGLHVHYQCYEGHRRCDWGAIEYVETIIVMNDTAWMSGAAIVNSVTTDDTAWSNETA